MEENEIRLKDILFYTLRKWRIIVIFALACAILVGSFVVIDRALDLADEKKMATWQAKYELARNTYWESIHRLEREISENERLAAEAKEAIELLNTAKTDHEMQIADLEADIVYYEALIADYQTTISQLREKCTDLEYYLEYRKEQNENSLLMAIDPYNVCVYESYLRVDSGYQIQPDSTYQDPDPTAELRQTYRLLVSNTEFYQNMIEALSLETEVRYLTEVISVETYSTKSLRVHVIAKEEAWAKKVGDYIVKAIKDAHTHVSSSIAAHDLTEYNANSYSVVDLSIYTKQSAHLQEATNYETQIREIDVTILNTEAEARLLGADIRTFRQQIQEIKLAIAQLPIQAQTLEQQINGYNGANVKLKADRLALLETPEPQYAGPTLANLTVAFVKYAAVGAAVGAFVTALYFAAIAAFGSKLLSPGQICESTGSKFFGFWPKKGKKLFAFIDNWLDRLAGNGAKNMASDLATDLVLSNIKLACADSKKVLLCGGAPRATLDALTSAVKALLPGAEIFTGGIISNDPDVVRGLMECDAVILVEQLDRSGMHAATELKDRIQDMNKPLLGVILT